MWDFSRRYSSDLISRFYFEILNKIFVQNLKFYFFYPLLRTLTVFKSFAFLCKLLIWMYIHTFKFINVCIHMNIFIYTCLCVSLCKKFKLERFSIVLLNLSTHIFKILTKFCFWYKVELFCLYLLIPSISVIPYTFNNSLKKMINKKFFLIIKIYFISNTMVKKKSKMFYFNMKIFTFKKNSSD